MCMHVLVTRARARTFLRVGRQHATHARQSPSRRQELSIDFLVCVCVCLVRADLPHTNGFEERHDDDDDADDGDLDAYLVIVVTCSESVLHGITYRYSMSQVSEHSETKDWVSCYCNCNALFYNYN